MSEDGMTFEIITSEVKDESRRKQCLTEGDFNITRTPHVVPNGKWVIRGVSGSDLPYHQYYLGDPTKIERIVLDLRRHTDDVLWVSDEPFGMLRWDRTGGQGWLPQGGIYFVSAKQVHKGQLGQLVPIPKLSYIREDKRRVQEWALGSRKRRSHIGWGRVSDLVEASGMSFEQIVERFWPFVDFNAQPEHMFPAELKMLVGESPEDIKSRQRCVQKLPKQEALEVLRNRPDVGNNIWIPEGLIKTILRLIALGYQPVGTVNA